MEQISFFGWIAHAVHCEPKKELSNPFNMFSIVEGWLVCISYGMSMMFAPIKIFINKIHMRALQIITHDRIDCLLVQTVCTVGGIHTLTYFIASIRWIANDF